MTLFIDIFMLMLFVIFMFFVFGGYHRSKYKKREAQELKSKTSELE